MLHSPFNDRLSSLKDTKQLKESEEKQRTFRFLEEAQDPTQIEGKFA